MNRIKTLIELCQDQNQKILILTTITSSLQKITPKSQIKNLGFEIKAKDMISIDDMIGFLVNNGYARNSTANDIGEFAVRGNIIDVIIYGELQMDDDLIGFRFDFFGIWD